MLLKSANIIRIQASPGYREAANYCLMMFQEANVKAEMPFLSADHKTSIGPMRMWRKELQKEALLTSLPMNRSSL